MSDLCVGLPDSKLPILYDSSEHVERNKGEILFEDVDPATHIFNIQEGSITLYRMGPSGQRQILGFLFSGDLFGISPGESYGVSAEACADTKLCRWERNKFDDFLVLFPAMGRQFRLIASKSLAQSLDLAFALGRLNAEQRLAAFFIHLNERQAEMGAGPNQVSLPMSRSDIADYLGLTIETVSRGITKLKKKGLINLIISDYIEFLDKEALKELAEGA